MIVGSCVLFDGFEERGWHQRSNIRTKVQIKAVKNAGFEAISGKYLYICFSLISRNVSTFICVWVQCIRRIHCPAAKRSFIKISQVIHTSLPSQVIFAFYIHRKLEISLILRTGTPANMNTIARTASRSTSTATRDLSRDLQALWREIRHAICNALSRYAW